MIENHSPCQNPYVIVLAGYVGAGKSTIAASISKVLESAAVLKFDHYEKYIELPTSPLNVYGWQPYGATESRHPNQRNEDDQ